MMAGLRCIHMVLLLHVVSGLVGRQKRDTDSGLARKLGTTPPQVQPKQSDIRSTFSPVLSLTEVPLEISTESDGSSTCREPSDDCCVKSVYKYEDDWFPTYKLSEQYVPPYEDNPEIPDSDYKTLQDYHERFYHMRPNFIEQFFEPYPIPFPMPDKTKPSSTSTPQVTSEIYTSSYQSHSTPAVPPGPSEITLGTTRSTRAEPGPTDDETSRTTPAGPGPTDGDKTRSTPAGPGPTDGDKTRSTPAGPRPTDGDKTRSTPGPTTSETPVPGGQNVTADIKQNATGEISQDPSENTGNQPADDGNNTALAIGAAVGGLAAIGCIAGVVALVFKVRAKLAALDLASGGNSSGANGSGSNGSGQALLSGGFNSVAPSSGYEPALQNVQIPDAPRPFGYDGAGGLGGPAEYIAPPSQQPQGPNIPQFNRYMMAGQEPPIPGTPGAAGYQVEPVLPPAAYDLWF